MKKISISLTLLLAVGFCTQMAFAQKESHSDYKSMKISECTACHKGEGVAVNHGADWLREHRVVAGKANANCKQCHQQSDCLDCHKGGGIGADLKVMNFGKEYVPRSHRTNFMSQHPLKALENKQTCFRCHDVVSFCNECHSKYPMGSLRIKSHLRSGNTQTFMWSSEHASEARRNLQSCQACHSSGDVCLRCHSAKSGPKTNPHPKNFKGGSISSRSDKSCKICH